MLKKSKRKTERFYRRLLAEAQRSGQSLRVFAAERGVPAGTLSWWRHELKRRDAAAASTVEEKAEAPQFVPVRVLEAETVVSPAAAQARTTRARSSASYEVVLGKGRVLRLPPDFDGARVAALVRAVEASC
jgi:hypothetical protein